MKVGEDHKLGLGETIALSSRETHSQRTGVIDGPIIVKASS